MNQGNKAAAPVEGLDTVGAVRQETIDGVALGQIGLIHQVGYDQQPIELVTRSQAEAIVAALKKDRLPDGHAILEQADIHDGTGRISQTVRVEATGEEYERIVHADEAYGEDE